MKPTRRNFLKNLALLGTFPFIETDTLLKVSSDPAWVSPPETPYGNVIEAPEDPLKWPAFRTELKLWRESKRKELNYTGESYKQPAFKWASASYACCFLMMYDLEFYDPRERKYTVGKILDRGKKEFGGYDSVVLWHAYPRIGIDERNQFDFYRDMPGGLAGVKTVVDEFHANNVKVFINYNPWDVSTRREPVSDLDGLIAIIAAIGADGIFLDTLKEAGKEFRAKLNNIRPGLVLEGELAADLETLPSQHLSWAQWFGDKYVPGVLRDKWFERNHMQHQIARWDFDHSTELHQAWMNGSGMMVWENVFGQWIAWNERDKSMLRTMLPIQRRFHQLFSGEGWTPLVETMTGGVFASLWEGNGVRLWTIVNRHDYHISGELIKVPHAVADAYYNLTEGSVADSVVDSASVVFSGAIPPRSIACFVAIPKKDAGSEWEKFLAVMRAVKAAHSDVVKVSEMKPALRKVAATRRAGAVVSDGMIEIQPVTIRQPTEFVIRECGAYTSSPQVSMTLGQVLLFEKMVHVGHIAVDITPVTNDQYLAFIKATGYQPAEKHNFLKHWSDNRPPAGKENHPVVYVDLNDARAYAVWARKRLPLESEWQFAAQGHAKLKYPWGKELKDDCYNRSEGTTAVDAFPSGKSPFGCLDMCGNTWELTESEYADEHNRFCILKGGSYFDPKGSTWYTRGGPQASAVATKFLLLYPGLDRCGTVGFRCVRDLG